MASNADFEDIELVQRITVGAVDLPGIGAAAVGADQDDALDLLLGKKGSSGNSVPSSQNPLEAVFYGEGDLVCSLEL